VLKNFEKLLRRTIREDIDIQLTLFPRAIRISADVGQIEQIVMNLAINAQDAMPDGGLLTIELSLVEMEVTPENKYKNIHDGTYVLLSVSDTGNCIDEEVQKQIFEPFFSTKGESGIGLGLATVYGIINQHKGDILVYSEPGIGTSFKVYLPFSDLAVKEKRKRQNISPDYRGTETILVVEDNEQVMELTETILTSLGYTVLTAEDGSKALELLSDYNKPVHMLLTDVIMPGINGKKLYERSLLLYESLKVLFMSGYADNAIARHNVIDAEVQFIQKPFSTKELAKKIREVLESDF